MKTRLFFLVVFFFVNLILHGQTKNITIDYDSNFGVGKKMTGVNTGPHSVVSGTTEQCLQNIGTELVRTHDYHGPCDYWGYTNFFNYGTQLFNYSFQTDNPFDYNWTSTNTQISEIVDANLQPFFRLGISFPGGGPSPASPMPKDFDGINFYTFAGIAKRTAMHYTDGWNGGFYYTIPYWEIWNEPNNGASWDVDSVTAYYRMYKQTVDSLKLFNPNLKVGGPGTAKNAFFTGGTQYTINQNYVSNFFSFLQTNSVPLDFYSFHMYDKNNPYSIRILTDTLAYYLDQYGFTDTELILSETNNDNPGYNSSAKGCSYITSQLIAVVNSRLTKFIWYRGVDLNPLCNSDIGSAPSLTLNGYAYKFFNELNDSTPELLISDGNEFNTTDLTDSLNNLMILSGKNSSNDMVKVLISNHESIYTTLSIALNNLPWTSSDQISITIDKVSASGFETSSYTAVGGATMTVDLNSVSDANVFLITLKRDGFTSMETETMNENYVLYPNPATSTVMVNTTLINYDLVLMNSQGQVLKNQKNDPEFDLSDVPNGLYFVMIQDENGERKKYKLIVSR